MTTLSIQMTADRDNLIASLALAQDLILTMDPSAISPDDQEIVMAAKLLQAAIARRASKPHNNPNFCFSQVQAAKMVCAALGLEPETFRANKPWLLLQKRHLGEGVGFFTPISKKTGKPSTRVRQYTQEAIDYLVDHWDLTRFEIG
ncbi:hypothetical protein HF563_08830 [Acidithiobacillus ferridurans]|uniref:hypothetical protein n=1 Tax=Acidithiobacillus ferrooxidans TaxID=920 RepID=UPI001C07EBC5|nr:hypothetical protein [Acidithiobacillus ferrooxidans]MBU2719474.1 hypothetical protein [Acidithiobacillus ferridurans]MBU2859063.1 hypothetical protein [Acidithiobacillus ferrooxidans]